MKIFTVLFIFSITILFANIHVNLTTDEKLFIKNHPLIHLASSVGFEPFLISNSDGTVRGYERELLDIITEKTGLEFSIELGDWTQMQERLDNREFDGFPSAGHTKKREKLFNRTDSYIKFMTLIITNKNSKNKIITIEDLNNKTVAIQEGNKLFKDILESLKLKNLIVLELPLIEDTIKAVVANKVDFALLDESVFYMAKQIGVASLIQTPFGVGKPFELMYWFRNDYPELTSIFNKVMKSLDSNTKMELRDKWFSKVASNKGLFFTKEEQKYLNTKQEIKMCIDPNWLPFSRLKDEKYFGIGPDIYKLISAKIPIPINIVKTENWVESLEFGQERKCDIFDFAIETTQRKEYLNFTTTFIKIPMIIVTKLDESFIYNFEVLKNKRIGIPKGYAFIELLKTKYPFLNIVEVKSIGDGLQKVKDGELFGYVGTLASVAYVFKENFTGELKVSGRFDENFDMGSAVRNDDALLFSILQKVISSIPQEKIDNIINKWISIKYEKEFDYKLFVKLLIGIFFVFIFFIYRHYLLNKKIKEEVEKSRKKDNLIFQQNKMVSLGEMIGDIAHQWRQPLAKVSMTQNYLLATLGDRKDISQDVVDEIHKSQEVLLFMSKTIDTFQNFYKKDDIECGSFYIYEAVENILLLFGDKIALESVEIIQEIDKSLVLNGSKNSFLQILLAIMQNSLYFLNSRQIKNPKIIVSVQREKEKIKITLKDNAGGIEEEFLAHVFEYGFSKRDDGTLSSGIGLNIVQLIVKEKFRGDISVENCDDGVVFKLFLPLNSHEKR